jgi:Ca-activated chloride channel homolog
MTKNLKPIDMGDLIIKRLFFGIIWSICLWVIWPAKISAQSYRNSMRKGAEAYDKGNLISADSNFTKAIAAKKNAESLYNLGNTRFKGQKYEEALDSYKKALDNVKVESIKANINYNLGNTLMELQRFDEAIDAYKSALKSNPGAQDIVHNLMLARLRKQQQEQEQKDQNQQSENSDRAPQDPKQDESSSSDQNESNQNNTDSEQLPQSTAQMLQAIENEESKVQQKLRNQHVRPNRSNKNW